MITTLLDAGIPMTAVDTATGTGTGFSNPFGVQQTPGGGPRTASYQCTGTFSVCTASIEQSFDNGVTWEAASGLLSSQDLYANPAGIIASLIGGPSYRFNVLTFTGTSVTIQLEGS